MMSQNVGLAEAGDMVGFAKRQRPKLPLSFVKSLVNHFFFHLMRRERYLEIEVERDRDRWRERERKREREEEREREREDREDEGG